MREILLTQGKVALVDDEDYDTLVLHKWQACKDHGGNWYAQRCRPRTSGKLIHVHREVLQAPDGVFVDHRDGNGLNNTKQNLRLCTNSQNSGNAKRRKDNSSGFKGVTVNKRRYGHRWVAAITCQKKTFYLGTFDDPAEAARVYDSKAKELFGEFARLNFLENPVEQRS